MPSGYKVYEQQNAIKDDFSLGQYYITDEKFNELRSFEVRPNDIIISCSGTVGKVAIAPSWMEPGIINQALLKLSLNENALTNRYFKILFPAFYMKTETLSELQGTAQKNMVSRMFKILCQPKIIDQCIFRVAPRSESSVATVLNSSSVPDGSSALRLS
ncbi:MAG: restriction endonuclease subunit S [Thiotrichales bacterium]